MLSAETAAGAYPVEAVAMMDRIIAKVERDPLYRSYLDAYHAEAERPRPTRSRSPPAQVASTMRRRRSSPTPPPARPRCARRASGRIVPILALITQLRDGASPGAGLGPARRRLEDARNSTEMVERACQHALARASPSAGSSLVITAGVPFGTPGATNLLRIAWVR